MVPFRSEPKDSVSASQKAEAFMLIIQKIVGRYQHLHPGESDGKVTAEIARALPRGAVLGTDASAEMIAFARKTFSQSQISNLKFQIAEGVAPGNPNLGAMLPSNPLHHLLMAELGFPVVATSGNLSDEPICTDEHEARERLGGIADVFLVHNRPIVRHVDDSSVRVFSMPSLPSQIRSVPFWIQSRK